MDQKVLFTDAYAIPFWLRPPPAPAEDAAAPSLFEASADGSRPRRGGRTSPARAGLLEALGITTPTPARTARPLSGCTRSPSATPRCTSSRTARPYAPTGRACRCPTPRRLCATPPGSGRRSPRCSTPTRRSRRRHGAHPRAAADRRGHRARRRRDTRPRRRRPGGHRRLGHRPAARGHARSRASTTSASAPMRRAPA